MSTQSLYEKIKIIVESGNIAICQFDNLDYILFSSMFYRGDGKTPYIRSSNRGNDINNCYQSLGASYETRYNINKRNLKYIGIYERPLWRPKLGDRVQTSTKIKKTPGYDSEWDFMDYLALEVVEVYFSYCVIKYGKEKHPAPYDCIAPRVEIDTI